MKWRTFNGEQIASIQTVVEKAILRETAAGNKLKVCIGTDSQVRCDGAEFATVIVFFARETRRFYVRKYRPHRSNLIAQRTYANRSVYVYQHCLRPLQLVRPIQYWPRSACRHQYEPPIWIECCAQRSHRLYLGYGLRFQSQARCLCQLFLCRQIGLNNNFYPQLLGNVRLVPLSAHCPNSFFGQNTLSLPLFW